MEVKHFGKYTEYTLSKRELADDGDVIPVGTKELGQVADFEYSNSDYLIANNVVTEQQLLELGANFLKVKIQTRIRGIVTGKSGSGMNSQIRSMNDDQKQKLAKAIAKILES